MGGDILIYRTLYLGLVQYFHWFLMLSSFTPLLPLALPLLGGTSVPGCGEQEQTPSFGGRGWGRPVK